MAVVTLKGLTKIYEGSKEPAVKDITFQVEDGEFMVLLGPSGCGKSTVLRMIAGLETITGGELSIDGQLMNNVPAKDRDIAMVFQSYALYPHMKVRDNLAFGLKRRGIPKIQISRRVEEVAASLGLTPYLNRRPHALSGGQRQRVAVGRAIVRDPKVFLFDEPLSNLDAALRVNTRNELVNLHERLGATTIYVTHDQVEAMTMGSRICIINEGQLVQIGPPMEVYRQPANTFVAGFLGSPPMNLLPADLEERTQGRLTLRIGGQTISVPQEWNHLMEASTGEVIFGIRPEDLFLQAQTQSAGRLAELDLVVSGVEALGAETVVILNLPGLDQAIFVKADRFAKARRGDQIRVWADLSAARLFDPHSKRVISRTN
ncbi:MAG: sn-glycerol-3-phosphate ABC transporter ATP-binding protein UgpC [Desulfobacterales bacterium]|nr:MAG: sn-glycerol-3-phosphate ABC transporter ATP-binding protein UgpC [Desulfobacterales bacterium]